MSLESFKKGLHPSTVIVSTGIFRIRDRDFDAIQTRNIYGQLIVWGMFGMKRGKFNGKLSNTSTVHEGEYIEG